MNNNFSNYLQKPVEVSTYFSSSPILGEVIDVSEDSVTIASYLI